MPQPTIAPAHRSPPPRARWRARLRRITALYGAGLALVAGAWACALAPWWAAPAEPRAAIEARWASLEALAAPRLPAGDPAPLRDAVVAQGASQVEVDDVTRASPLDPASRRALERLVAWDRGGGGLGEGLCLDRGLSTFTLLGVAELAIARAGGPDDPRMRAALRLGAALRDRGPLITALVGHAIFDAALDRFEAAGWAPSAALHELRPRASGVPSILAREAICGERWAARALQRGEYAAGRVGVGELERLVAAVGVDPGRELLHLRADLGARLERALAAPDRAGLVAALAPTPREEAPKSLVVRDAAFALDGAVKDLLDRLDRVDARLDRLAAGPRRGCAGARAAGR